MRTTCAALGMVLVFAACSPSQEPDKSSETAAMEEAHQAAAGEGKTSAEAEAVSQLNAMCPENWCMDDYQYEFLQIVCAGESCTLTFTAEANGKSTDGTVELDHDEPLIDEFGDLEAGYFERVTDALDEWQSTQASS